MRFKILKPLAIVTVCLIFAMQTFAQTGTSGRVVNKEGNGIPGVTVSSGNKAVATTDANGNFTTTVATGRLTFSSVGYEATSTSAGGSNVSVTMETQTTSQQEVVVVGYGTRKVKDATGSVALITPKDFNKGQISTPEQLFQGRTPGVTVTPASGEPGAAATINIRGTSSIRSNQQPLYVVDGVPLDGGGTTGSSAGAEGGTTPKNPLMFINPNDIESINILKDASSAAIYGARGANGVVIITTKNGRGAKGSWNFGSTTSISSTASRYNLLNASEFIKGVIDENVQLGTPVAIATTQAQALNLGSDNDWQDKIFRTAISQNYNLSYGFAKNKMTFRASGAYDDQQGIIKNSYMKRLTGRVNFTKTFLSNDALRFEFTTNLSNIKNSYVANTNNAGYLGSLIGAAIRFNPTYPEKNPDGTYYFPGNGDRNPAAILAYIDDKDNINRSLTSVALSYKITNGLVFKTTLGYDYSKGVRTSYTDPRLGNVGDNQTRVFDVGYGNGTQGNGRAAVQNEITKNLVWENFLTYDKTFNTRHVINAVLGTSYQKADFESNGDVYWGLNTPVVTATDVFNKSTSNFKNKWYLKTPYVGQTILSSGFARVNYTLDDKYLLTATARVDGSSKFGKDNRYGFFPAVGAKWRILNEKFAKGLQKTFSDFSLRANWGKIGSQDALTPYSAYQYSERWITSNPNAAPITYGSILRNQANPNLKWEEATTTSVALDWATKNRRFSGTIEFYNTDRANLVFLGPVPGGFSASRDIFFNLPGIVNNKGLEISLNYQIIKGNKFNWDASLNMTFMSNEVRDLGKVINTGEVNGPGLTGAYAQRIADGYPMFSWYAQEFTGYDANGFPTYVKDANGNAELKILNKSALPKFNAGLTNNFSYGRWNASLFMNAVTGFYVYNNTANAHFLAGILKNGGNVTRETAASPEHPLTPGTPSTRFIEKGDFLRISNLVIGYNFNIKSKFIKSLSANLSGQNLALFTNYTGLDPEVNVDKQQNGVASRGFDYAGYPRPRVFSLGFNIGF